MSTTRDRSGTKGSQSSCHVNNPVRILVVSLAEVLIPKLSPGYSKDIGHFIDNNFGSVWLWYQTGVRLRESCQDQHLLREVMSAYARFYCLPSGPVSRAVRVLAVLSGTGYS
jgi:hypothetical protein